MLVQVSLRATNVFDGRMFETPAIVKHDTRTQTTAYLELLLVRLGPSWIVASGFTGQKPFQWKNQRCQMMRTKCTALQSIDCHTHTYTQTRDKSN